MKRRLSAIAEPIASTSSSEVTMSRRFFLSSSRVPATTGNMLFTTAEENANVTRPTMATAA